MLDSERYLRGHWLQNSYSLLVWMIRVIDSKIVTGANSYVNLGACGRNTFKIVTNSRYFVYLTVHGIWPGF